MMQTPHAARDRRRRGRWAVVACIALGSSLASSAVSSVTQGSAGHRHVSDEHTQFGIASVYARMLHGHMTASGEKHDGNDFTAAHRTLPLGSRVRVTNLANHRSVVVRINDRGPQLKSRIIDLSPGAAAEIGLRSRGRGLARVRLDVLPSPSPDEPASATSDVAGMNEKQITRASKERAVLDTHETRDVKP